MTQDLSDSIALVGLAGHFPGARSASELWTLLENAQAATEWRTPSQLREAGVSPADLADPDYVRASLILPDMENFDAGFFGFSPRDAAVMDPQHRHFLACAWEALEDAGHMPEKFAGSIGVFAGCGMQNYLPQNLLSNPALVKSMGLFLLRHTGNDKDFLTSRLSYLLDLKGPSITVQTACSTSLVAVHLASQSLLSGECDMALAGGVSIELPHRRGYHYAAGEILSPDGVCRAFDAQAAGTLFGSGAGVVVLRRLADALADGDQIYAVIRGSAVNNDGAQKAGYLAPSVEGQASAAVEALAMADVAPASVQYIEAHGTGTPVGDPIEVAALAQAYGSGGAAGLKVGLGSLKTNIGHLDTAAGVAGLIKVALAFRHGLLPASLNFKQANPRLALEKTPFKVLNQSQPWPRGNSPRRAAVNALGVGGTNAHVILEEAPAVAERQPGEPLATGWQLLTFSARTPAALQRLQSRWLEFLKAPPAQFNLADAAHTLRVGRREFAHRLAVVAQGPADLAAALAGSLPTAARSTRQTLSAWQAEAAATPPAVVMMFPGGGAPYPGAGRALLGQPAFAEAVQACFDELKKLGADVPADLHAVMFAEEFNDGGTSLEIAAALLQQPRYGLVALFVLSYALARLWQRWGVQPAALIGHSAGDYAAACIAGVMSLEDALSIVVLRARLFEQSPPGGMLGVDLTEAELQAHLDASGGELDIAVVNAADHCIASGALGPLAALEKRLAEQGVTARRLRIDVAAHSRLLDGVLDEFAQRMAQVRLSPPQIPMVSNLSGTWARTDQVTDPAYWVQHLRQPVRFAKGLDTALTLPGAVMLEVGPGQGLLALAQQAQQAKQIRATPVRAALLASTGKAQVQSDDLAVMLGSAGALWTRGLALDWPVTGGSAGRRISLPTYAFEPERHWIAPGQPQVQAAPAGMDQALDQAKDQPANKQDRVLIPSPPVLSRLPELADWILAPRWLPAPLPPHDFNDGAVHDSHEALAGRHWLLFGGPARLTADLVLRLLNHGARVTLVRPGLEFARLIDGSYTLDPAEPLHYRLLVQALAPQGMPAHILHLWAMDAGLQTGQEMAEMAEIAEMAQIAEMAEISKLKETLHGSETLPGQTLSFDSLLYLAQALQAEDLDSPLRLTVLTTGSQSVGGERDVQPAQALALGPCRVIPQELPGLRTRLVDLPAVGSDEEVQQSLPRRVIAECLADDAADLVALRGRERLVLQLQPALTAGTVGTVGTAATGADNKLLAAARLRQGGVYLITGGLGAVALTLAEHLARNQQARLALLSRRNLPPAEQWQALVDAASSAELSDSESQAWLLQRLLALQAAGAQLLLLSADVTDAQAMAKALAQCRGRFGALHGVFHAAGVLDDGPIHSKTSASVRRVLAAKALGAQVLHTLLPPGSLDVFAVFSSTSVYLGAPGQIDYVAANAYLDALAASRPDGLCIHWGVWGDAGMAKRAYLPHKVPHEPSLKKGVGQRPDLHPLLGHRVDDDAAGMASGARFMARLDPAALWLLREHQVAGEPVLVGMAYVEMARAAWQCLHPGTAIELRALSFGEALVFEGSKPREVMTTLRADLEHAADTPASAVVYAFEVHSRADAAAPWQAHARASVHGLDGAALEAAKAEEALKLQAFPEANFSADAWQVGQTPQARWLRFGHRWQCVRRMQFAPPACGMAELALPADCSADAASWAFHPALADMAATFALQLPQVPDTALYVPLSVARIRLFAPLGAALASRVLLTRQDSDRLLGFDVQLRAPDGQALASLEGFCLRGVPPEALARAPALRQAVRAPSLIERMLASGIQAADAPQIYARIFAGSQRDLIVSSLSLPDLRAVLAPREVASAPVGPAEPVGPAGPAGQMAPATSAASATPSTSQHDPVHQALAAAWRELLGVDTLALDDDFFALGGHSLAAVRLFARIRKVFGVDLPLATLFETPTLGALVERVRAECPPAAVVPANPANPAVPLTGNALTGNVPLVAAASAGTPLPATPTLPITASAAQPAKEAAVSQSTWSPLVRINAGRPGVKPLFCVHGAAGNVLNFKVIADRLGASQPFYGLQAQGVDGRLPPLPSIEAMASRYIAAIRAVDPVGPYCLAGYSGGGVIAFEMAQQLQRAGAQVALLAMLDTLAPAAASARLSPLRKLWLMRHWSLGFTLAWPERRRTRRTEHANHLLALQALARGEPLTPELASARLFSHFVAAQSQYQPQPYAGDLLLLRAEQGYTPYLNAGAQLGWQALVGGSIRVVEIPGSHVSMLTEPGLTQLARALREHMAQSERVHEDGRGPHDGTQQDAREDGHSAHSAPDPVRLNPAIPGAFVPGLLGNAMQRDWL